MPEPLRESRPKARKDHCCSCCTGLIPAGTTYHRATLIDDGRVYDWLTCEGCEGLTNEVYVWAGYPDGGVGYDDYLWWAAEVARAPGPDGDAARAWAERAGMAVA